MVGVALPAQVGLAIGVLVLSGVVTYALNRRAVPGALPLAAGAAALAVAAGVVAILGRIGGPRSLSWAAVASLVLVFVGCWLWFIAAYTGSTSRRAAPFLALLPGAGVLTLGYLYLTGDPIPRSPTASGPFYVAFFTLPSLFVGALFLGSILVTVRTGLSYGSSSLRRCVALAGAAVAGGLLPLLFVSLLDPAPSIAAAGFAAGTLTAAAGFGLAVVRYDLFESVPVAEAVGRDRLVTELADPIVVVDAEGAVVDLNDAAERALDVSLSAVVGTPLSDLLDVEGAVAAIGTVDIDREDGNHAYEASGTAVTYGDQVVGHALVLRDVTDRQTRRQRLEVLNRVLRHNLRNDMTAVMGYADLLAADHEASPDLLERIHETADALTELGDKAREIEQIMAASAAGDAETDLARLVQYVAAEARKRYPDAEVTVDLGGDVRVSAAEDVCWPIVWNLVENGIEHHDEPDPAVALAVRAVEDRAEIVVEDDGPGLPENERRAVVEGKEQPLSHGSGLGLWAVKWGATRVGGEVHFADAEPRGTRVTVRLPLATGTRTGDDAPETNPGKDGP